MVCVTDGNFFLLLFVGVKKRGLHLHVKWFFYLAPPLSAQLPPPAARGAALREKKMRGDGEKRKAP